MPKDFSNLTDPPYNQGIINNNPGNLRPGDNWIGMTGTRNNFVTFKDISFGLRAMAVDLANKINKGYDTITKIITRYAPPSENDTQSYINSVAGYTGWNADDTITADAASLGNLMRAQINVEQGDQSKMITDEDITEGISLIPQSIISRVSDFFANSPIAAAAVSYGAIAVVVVLVIIVVTAVMKGRLNLKKQKS